MRNLTSTLFPLAVLAALAGLTYWLIEATALPAAPDDGKDRHNVDYVIQGMQLRKLDGTGHLQYVLATDEARHYPDDDSTDVDRPDFTYYNPARPTLNMKAVHGHISADGDTIDLHDDVRLRRDATADRPALLGYMDTLSIDTVNEIATSKSPVRFNEGASWLKGVGMRVDNVNETYVLESQASGLIESRRKAK